MSNYNSIPQRFNSSKSRINHRYISQIMQEKQGKIDQNFGLLQESVEKVLGVDLAREKDRENLKSKVSSALNILDQSEVYDFESSKSKYVLQDALLGAAKDPEILKQIANTKKLRQVQAFQQERSKKGNLNQVNFQYAYNKAGRADYMAGDSDDMGNFQYLEYVDVNKKMREVAKDYQAMKPDEIIKVPDGQGGIIETKKSSMTQPQWTALLAGSLDANDQKQLQINGSARYGFNDQLAVSDLENKKLEAIQPNLKRIEDLQSDLLTADAATKERLNAEIETLTIQNKKIENQFDKIGKTADQIGGYYMMNNTVNNLAAFMAQDGRPSYGGVDQAYFKNKAAAESKTGTDLPSGSKDYTGDGVSDLQAVATPKDLQEDKKINTEKIFTDGTKKLEQSLSSNVNKIYNSITDPKVKQAVDNFKAKQLKLLGDERQALVATISHFSSGDTPIISLSQKETLMNQIQELDARHAAVSNAADYAIQNSLGQNSKIFDEVYNKDTNIRVHGIDSNVTIKDYLTERGITNEQQYIAFMEGNSQAAKNLKASLLMQSSGIKYQHHGKTNGGQGISTVIISKEERIRLNKIEELTGEKFTFNRGQKTLADVKNGERVFLDESAGKFINNGLKAIQQGGNTFGRDRIATEDSDLMEALGNRNIKQNYETQIDLEAAKIPGNNAITIQGSKGASRQSAYKNELQGLMPGVAFEDGSEIMLVPINDREYQVFETQQVAQKNGLFKSKGSYTEFKGTVNIDQLNKAEDKLLIQAIDFKEKKKEIEFALDRKYQSPSINYMKDGLDSAKQIIEYLGENNPLTTYASREEFIRLMKQNHQQALPIVKNILDNSNAFRVNFESARIGQNGGVGVLDIQSKNGDSIYQLKVSKEMTSEYLKYAQVMPEIFLSKMVEQVIKTNDQDTYSKIRKAIEQ